MPTFESGVPARPSRESIRRDFLEKERAQLEGLKIQTERTRTQQESRENAHKAFLDSISAARKRIVDRGCLEQLQKTRDGLPDPWKRWLTRLESLATPSGDSTTPERLPTRPSPIAILRYIYDAQPQVEREAANIGLPPALEAAQKIKDVFTAFQNAIGTLPSEAIVSDPFAWAHNPDIAERSGHLVRVGVFVLAAASFVATSIIALLTKENPNWKLPAIWLLFAGLAAGWGDITGSRNDRLGRQVGFLTSPNGSWENLQSTYGLRGPAWAQFARTLMQDERGNAAIARVRRSRTTLTEEEQNTIVALAPTEIHKQVRAMLASGTGQGAHRDFRGFLGLLGRARTEEAQNLVTVFMQEGATVQSVDALFNSTAPARTA